MASSSSGAEYDLLDPLSQALSLSMLDSIVGGGGGGGVGGGGIGGGEVGAANDNDADAVFPDFGLADAAAVGGEDDDAFETFAIDSDDDDDFLNLGTLVASHRPPLQRFAMVGCCVLCLAEAAAPPPPANQRQHHLETFTFPVNLDLFNFYLQYLLDQF